MRSADPRLTGAATGCCWADGGRGVDAADMTHLPRLVSATSTGSSAWTTTGHVVGDPRAAVTADRCFVALVRLRDTVARIGGDEFVVLLHDEGDDVAAVAARIAETLGDPVLCDPQVHGVSSARVRVSVGAARAEHRDESFSDVLRRADAAMYLDKHGRPSAPAGC